MNAAKLFAQEYTQSRLRTLYDEHISTTSAIGIDRINRIKFEDHLDRELELIEEKLKPELIDFHNTKKS